MRLLFELSGEHATLPAAEALAALEAMAGPGAPAARVLHREPGLLTVEAPDAVDPHALLGRLGLAHRASEPVGEPLDPAEDAILAAVRAHAAPRLGPRFRVRVHRLGEAGRALSAHGLERRAGALLAEGRRVVLHGEADELRVLVGERAHLARLLAEQDRRGFEDRHVRYRPYFKPVSLHPRLARAMVNLARVRPGQRVADPFAGTGGILLEAALLSARVVGSDLDEEAAGGAQAALKLWGFEAQGRVFRADVAEALERMAPVDAVVSDPPYGRMSTLGREPPLDLYRRFLEAARDALRPGGRVVAVFPTPDAGDLAPPGLALEQAHVQRVNRSLDRHFVVLRKDAA